MDKDQIRTVMVDFYDRLFSDAMVGFLFHEKDKARLIEKETEFTQRFLGEHVPYTGMGMRQAHAKVPILGGHFDRRMQVLREVLQDHDVSEPVQERWLGHAASLRRLITADKGSECNHDAAQARISAVKIHSD